VTSRTEPSAEAPAFAWLDARIRRAVDGVASADPNPADPFRGLYVSDEVAVALARQGPDGDFEARLRLAYERLGLSALESAVLALCAAPDLSPHYGRLFAYLQDDVTRKLASPRLVAELLRGDGVAPGDVLACFATSAPLRSLGAITLVEFGGPTPLAERGARLADPLAAFLLGARLDAAAGGARFTCVAVPEHPLGRDTTRARLAELERAGGRLPLVVAGPDAPQVLAAALERPLLVIDAADAGDADLLADAAIVAALEGRAIVFDGFEELDPGKRASAWRAMTARAERALICARSAAATTAMPEQGGLVVEVPLPTLAERRAAWVALAGTPDVEDVAAKFRLSVTQIANACEVAMVAASASGRPTPRPDDLDAGARRASSSRLGELAVRLPPSFDWDDLVLPDRQRDVLQSISGYLRHRDVVLTDWGFGRALAGGQGLKVLFAGESGTGKTMAAQVLANGLGLDLYRIDLATVVSKYIGETEKNLDRIFGAAEGSNAILFFDEADSVFGKRSEIRDSHDRYANIEVAYLLQKMESYAGAVILATNFRHNVDEAFLRRLDFVIDFPFPEADDRERIWRLLLPASAPIAEDVDVRFLAERFKLSGGSIRNAAVAAAFMAADAGGPIGMRHLVRGVALEYGKLGRLTLETEFERFHEFVRG
jgi:hypothetical protein